MKPYNQTDKTKSEEVREMFDRIAPKYDLLNHTLSAGIDKLWRRRVVRIVRRRNPRRILDVATGTGDLAIALARRLRETRIMAVDPSAGMLAEAVTVAFGVRNFGDLDKGLRELRRTLKPGGQIVILEFSTPTLPVIRTLYRWYSHTILPRIGGSISKDRSAYEYLPASVDEFPAPELFLKRIAEAGFRNGKARSLTLGIARIYTGER